MVITDVGEREASEAQIPQFDVNQPNLLSRFVKMIDQFYDHRTRVIVTAQTDVDHLFDRVFDKEKAIQKELADVGVEAGSEA